MKLQAVVDSFKSSCRTSIWKKNPTVFSLQLFPVGSSEISGILYILCGSHIYSSLLSELSLLKLLTVLSHAQCL